ncbi:MAG: hypothetical protein WCJ45_02390 [bacterium]
MENEGTKEEIKNLLIMKDDANTKSFLNHIMEGKRVVIKITQGRKNKNVTWDDKKLFSYEVSRAGNAQYNAVSVIRDMLKLQYPEISWTRKIVEPLIWFEN